MGLGSMHFGTTMDRVAGYFSTNTDESFALQPWDKILSFTINSTRARRLIKWEKVAWARIMVEALHIHVGTNCQDLITWDEFWIMCDRRFSKMLVLD
jgi:hypothetical protein